MNEVAKITSIATHRSIKITTRFGLIIMWSDLMHMMIREKRLILNFKVYFNINLLFRIKLSSLGIGGKERLTGGKFGS